MKTYFSKDPETAAIQQLYLLMPGAPQPEMDENTRYRWDEVIFNPYWEFCRGIVEMVEDRVEARLDAALAKDTSSAGGAGGAQTFKSSVLS